MKLTDDQIIEAFVLTHEGSEQTEWTMDAWARIIAFGRAVEALTLRESTW